MPKYLYITNHKVPSIQRNGANIISVIIHLKLSKELNYGMYNRQSSRFYTTQLTCCFFRTDETKIIYVDFSRSTSLSKLNVLSGFDSKIIKPNYLAS